MLNPRVMVLAAIVACGGGKPPPPDRSVERMLGCIECIAGEQDSVVAIGEAVIPRLRNVVLGDSTVHDAQRARASLALGRIGGDSARRVLCDGRVAGLGPRVNRFIDSALVLMAGRCP